ncbi:NXPE family member 1-like [Pomacea canaliculata]|uniref:NXPE family member 1-like n=1 Tax=Pomacea canaliculata TaxID=400727 RepID=UPI000D7281B9|nr:NXPE family member 1-like [Pomacea canaliculata]
MMPKTVRHGLLLALALATAGVYLMNSMTRSRNIAILEPKPLSDQYTRPPEVRNWLTVPSTCFASMDASYELLKKKYNEDKLDFRIVEAFQVARDSLSDVELDILKDEPLTDVNAAATHTTSLLQLAGLVPNRTYRQGEVVTVRVDIRDAHSRPANKGGHSVRVWMADRARGLSAAASVADLNNGSYLASFPVLWAGRTTVFAALMESREYRRILLHGLDTRKTSQPVFAGFTMGNISETTFCLSVPVIPSTAEVCNFTSVNDGLPWYCGRPTNPELTCDDWFVSRSPFDGMKESPVTQSEALLLNHMKEYTAKKGRIFRLPQTVHINADGGTGHKADQPCHLLQPRVTWDDRSPSGFWSGQNWSHLLCQLPSLNSLFLEKCFKNKTFFMLGDSNARTIFEAIARLSKCTMSLAVHPSNLPTHIPKSCDSKVLSFHQEWKPHAYPFHNSAPWNFRLVKHSASFYLDRIPSRGNYVILIHLYLHFQFHHSHLFMLHVRDAVRGVRDLLARNPAAKVVVRGPHAWLPVSGDWHGLRVRRLLREEFRRLEDKVVYLDFWDMTVACENLLSHPDQYVLNTMTRIFLGHVCS